MIPPIPKRKQFYPIHQTAPGPDCMESAIAQNYTNKETKEYKTYNPIPENETFVTTYQGKKIIFRIDMNFYTNPNFIVIELINVEE